MKKIIVRIVLVVLVLGILAVVGVGLFVDSIVKKGVVAVGPQITLVPVGLDEVDLSILSGSGTIKGLSIGNPEGFKTTNAITVGTATLALQPGSLLKDKVVIKKIELIAPEITFEGGFGGNNLSKLLANLEQTTGGGTNAAPSESQPGKKLQVDDFLLRDAKLHVSVTGMAGRSLPVSIPEIHLTGLGQGPDGITPGELTKIVLKEVEKFAIAAADKKLAELGKTATDALSREANKALDQGAQRIGRGLGDLLKKE
jgi:hypothetical protein